MARKKSGSKKNRGGSGGGGRRGGGGGSGGGKKDFSAKLKKLHKKWDQHKEESAKSGFAEFPGDPGDYYWKLISAVIGEFGKLGLAVKFGWECAVGEFAGEASPFHARSLEDEEQAIWLQRDLRSLGVELDDVDIETLPELLEELVSEEVCAIGTVTAGSKGGQFFNLKRVVDSDELDEAIHESGMEEGDEGDEGEDEETPWEKGDRCAADFDGEIFEGEIKSIKGDEAKVKFDDDSTETVALDDLLEAEEDEGEEGDEKEYAFNEGDRVMGEFDGEEYEGEVTGTGDTSVGVLWDGEKKPEIVKVEDCDLCVIDAEEDDEGDEGEEGEESDDLAKGDRLWWEDEDGNELTGDVVSINEKKNTAKVKPDGEKKSVEVDLDAAERLDDE